MEGLRDLKSGQIFRGNSGREYIVLENNARTIKRTILLLSKDRVCRRKFSTTSNKFNESELYDFLQNEYYDAIQSDFNGSIIEHEINMISADGLDTYGKCRQKVGLLTLMMYQQYRRIIGDGTGWTWWLATPWSTPEGSSGSSYVAVVGSDGSVNFGDCDYECGVRPFFVVHL